MMEKTFLAVAFILSALALQWWVAVLIAIAYLSEGGSAFLIILGGMLIDALYGAPVAALHGFSYIYTLLMLAISLTTMYLRRMLFE